MTHSLVKVVSSRWLRFLLIALPFLFVVHQTGFGRAETLSAPPTMELTFQDGLISAELVDAPLIDVLERIKQEFGFKTHYHGDLTELITVSFTDLTLPKCLRLLTANQSLSVATRPSAEALPQNDEKQIAEIWVLSRSATTHKANIPPAASLAPAPAPAPAPNQADDTVSVSEDSLTLPENPEQKGVPAAQDLNNQKVEQSSKRQTINDLAAIGDPASVIAIAAFTRDADKEVRRLAVNGISSVQSDESTQILGQILQDEPDPDIRKTALRALSQRQSDMAAQTFLEGALNDADVGVKTLADQLLSQ